MFARIKYSSMKCKRKKLRISSRKLEQVDANHLSDDFNTLAVYPWSDEKASDGKQAGFGMATEIVFLHTVHAVPEGSLEELALGSSDAALFCLGGAPSRRLHRPSAVLSIAMH